jgi:putative transposase
LLRQADVDLGKGANVPDVCRRLGISQQTYSLGGPGTAAKRWSRGHGSEDGEAASGLQKENSRLKKLVADQALDMLILKEAARPHARVPKVN